MDDGNEIIGTAASSGVLVVGKVVGWHNDGAPIVRFDGASGHKDEIARTALPLRRRDLGAEVVLMFDDGCADRPVVLGRLASRARWPQEEHPTRAVATVDGERVEITGEREIVLRCGKASITLTRTGKIILRGTDILSRSSGSNRIKGGSIQLN